ncbi:MAG TPA: DNA double-strand break repair nuclease NurA [Chloroflexi bacterium]|nr:DNA double-strand break repair nuclease NurA [Chloroflexota bacterium]
MTLELNRLTQAVRGMAQTLARQQENCGQLVEQARTWLAEFADEGPMLQEAAQGFKAAIPTHEPLDAVVPLPALPERFTVIGADGSQIQPDRHGMALYYLINVGSLVYRHGSGQTPEARSVPDLRYRDEDLYEGSLLVAGNLLDVRRDQAEIEHLAERVEAEPEGLTLALVDGTLLLWVLENLPTEVRKGKIEEYLEQLERIRCRGAAVAAFTSRPRYTEVTRLLHLARMGGDLGRAQAEPNPLERVPDRAVFSFLPPGARSALFGSPSGINQTYYREKGHEIYFFYVNVTGEGEEAVVARVEVPAWVGDHGGSSLLALVHGGVVAQSRIAGGFPYVLARADELAYISGPERERLQEMVGTALLAAGLSPALSPKAYYKSLTRRGRGW